MCAHLAMVGAGLNGGVAAFLVYSYLMSGFLFRIRDRMPFDDALLGTAASKMDVADVTSVLASILMHVIGALEKVDASGIEIRDDLTGINDGLKELLGSLKELTGFEQ